jgi:hypothetical protein
MHEVHTHGEVMLPVCGRFTAISLAYVDYTPRLRFPLCPAGGVFTALAALTVKRACLENRELEELVSSRCPRLKELVLEDITLLSRHHILSIRIYDRTHLRSYGLTVPPCWMTVVGSNSKLPPQSSRSCPCAYGVWAWTLTSPHPSSPRCTGANPGSIDYFLVFITPIGPWHRIYYTLSTYYKSKATNRQKIYSQSHTKDICDMTPQRLAIAQSKNKWWTGIPFQYRTNKTYLLHLFF